MGQLVQPDRVTTVRLPEQLAQVLDTIARAEDRTMSSVIRDAVSDWVAGHTADEAFKARLRERIAADQFLLDRLAAPDESEA